MSAGTIAQRGPNSWRFKVERNGRQHTKTVRASSRREADKMLAAFVVEVDSGGRPVASPKMSVGDYLDRWLAGLDRKPLTLLNYGSAVKTHLKPALGAIRLRDLSALDIKTAFAGFAKKLKPSSLRQVRNVLAAALSDAEKFDQLATSPMHKLKGELPIGPPAEAVPVNADKIAELLAETDSHYSIAIMLCIAAGIRRGEALGLRWANVDLEGGSIRIVEQLTPLGFGPPKSRDGIRTIRLPPAAIDRLRAHRRMMVERLLGYGRRLQDHHTVACTYLAAPLCPQQFTAWAARRGFKLHNLRHSHLTELLRAGVPLAGVAKRAGHSSPAITLRTYAHALDADDDSAAEVAAGMMR